MNQIIFSDLPFMHTLVVIIGICAIIASAVIRARMKRTGDANDDGEDSILQTECPNCGQSHDMDYPACPHCKYSPKAANVKPKQPKAKHDETEMQCPKCGTIHDRDYYTCPYCGHIYSPLV